MNPHQERFLLRAGFLPSQEMHQGTATGWFYFVLSGHGHEPLITPTSMPPAVWAAYTCTASGCAALVFSRTAASVVPAKLTHDKLAHEYSVLGAANQSCRPLHDIILALLSRLQ